MLKRLSFIVFLFCQQIEGLTARQIEEVTKHGIAFNGEIEARISQYDTSHYNLLINQVRIPIKTNTVHDAHFLNSSWKIQLKANKVASKPDAIDYELVFKCTTGNLHGGSVSVNFGFNNWAEENYVLIPSVAYNGNRYSWRRLRYSPKLHDIKDIGPNNPIIVNDVPKLTAGGAVSRIQDRSGAASTPAMGFRSAVDSTGWMILTGQGNDWGDYGLGVDESRNRDCAIFTISSPVVREQYTYHLCDSEYPSFDIPANYKTGDEIKINFRVYAFAAPHIQSLFDNFAAIRKSIDLDRQSSESLSYWACMQLLEQKFNQKNYVPQYGYYSVGMRENYLQDWQIGWTGGMISTYPLLFAGNAQTRQNVINNFNWLFSGGISPSGFYWDACSKGTNWIGGDIRNIHTKNWHLIRKSGDAVWYILKQFMLMQKMGISVHENWKQGNKRVCDTFVKLWQRYHQLGQFVDSQTGDIIVGGSASGAIVPAALVLAAQYYHQPVYLQTALQIGNYLNTNFTEKGITCGGPGDALQAFDSESAYALVESYTELYEATRDTLWLARAQNAAKQFASWVVSYNYLFADTTAFGKAKIHTIGAVYANVQNKHAAPGICTASGLALLKLYRYTGDTLYINLLHDIAHNIPQYLAYPTKLLANEPLGCVSERINLSDWEGPNTIGYMLPLSTWAETTLMLTTVEIPGLYIQPDNGFFIPFDNVLVKMLSNNREKLVLKVTNPTKFETHLTVLSENSHAAKLSLPENALYGQQKIIIKPYDSTILSFRKE